MASMSMHGGGSPVPLSMPGGAVTAAGYPLSGPAAACPGGGVANVPKKNESLGPAGTVLEGQLLTSEYASASCPQSDTTGPNAAISLVISFWAHGGFVKI